MDIVRPKTLNTVGEQFPLPYNGKDVHTSISRRFTAQRAGLYLGKQSALY